MDKLSIFRDSESSSSTISTSAIENIIDRLKNNHHRKSTVAIYHTVWRIFNQFFLRLDHKPSTWEERLILFVGYLIDQDRKSSTIRRYVSAIKSVLRDDGIILNENKYLLASLTQACKLKNDMVRTRLPIRKSMLKLLLKHIHRTIEDQPYLLLMYKAIISTVYFGLFRVGELTSGTHPVRARDVHIADNKKK